MTRGAWPSEETSPRSSGRTLSPATSSSTGSMPATVAASTRSSLSTAKSPVSSRCLRAERSFRTSRSVSFWRDSIRFALGSFGVGVERGLRALGDGRERLRIAHGDVGERLAIELDPGLLHACHEPVVREVVLARRRVDADDPQRAERPLAILAIAVCVDERVLDLLLREAVARLLAPVVALRLIENLGA